MCSIDVKIFQM